MEYISEINAFRNWLTTNPEITNDDISLWYALMHINNTARWIHEFSVSISTLIDQTRLSRSAIYRSRNNLVKMGRIKTIERKGNQSSLYEMISFVSPNRTQDIKKPQFASPNGTQVDTQSKFVSPNGMHSGTQNQIASQIASPNGTINKTILLLKEEDNTVVVVDEKQPQQQQKNIYKKVGYEDFKAEVFSFSSLYHKSFLEKFIQKHPASEENGLKFVMLCNSWITAEKLAQWWEREFNKEQYLQPQFQQLSKSYTNVPSKSSAAYKSGLTTPVGGKLDITAKW